MTKPDVEIVPYCAEYAFEGVKLIRRSFATAMSIDLDLSFSSVEAHQRFFSRYPIESIRVAMNVSNSTIVGCLVLDGTELEQLYVHEDFQRQGIGSRLMNEAKSISSTLELYAFQRNKIAQSFYPQHGFHEASRGYADFKGNPWATEQEQLADIKYVWNATVTS